MTAVFPEAPSFGQSGDVLRVVARFEDRTLPKAEWTHSAHLAVALWYASRLPFDDALAAVRDGIQEVNAAHGVATTPSGGYHETITRFYLRVICGYVANEERDAGGNWAVRVNRLLQRYGAKDLPLRHYTKERLMSVEARFGWVEPDLLSLPGPSDQP
ncbi:MAG TPA: hypothetical protein VG500_16515 [Gemmatimonadales bacterium]|jgi:hypothetical protein|nr:hypothetical protein [Gemmatimonadales bacterium]